MLTAPPIVLMGSGEPPVPQREVHWYFVKQYENNVPGVRDSWDEAIDKHSFTAFYPDVSQCVKKVLQDNGMDQKYIARLLSHEESGSMILSGVGSENLQQGGVYFMYRKGLSRSAAGMLRDTMDVSKANKLFYGQRSHKQGRQAHFEAMGADLRADRGAYAYCYLGETGLPAEIREAKHNSFSPDTDNNQFNAIGIQALKDVCEKTGLPPGVPFEVIVSDLFMTEKMLPEVQKIDTSMTLDKLRFHVEAVVGAVLHTANLPGGHVRDHGHTRVPPTGYHARDGDQDLIHEVRLSLNLSSPQHELCRCIVAPCAARRAPSTSLHQYRD